PPAVHIPIMAMTSWYDAQILMMMPLIFAGLIVMIGGMGVYFSTAFKKTSTAVMFTIGTMLVVWLFLPLMILWGTGFRSYGHDNIGTQLFFDSNPAVQVWAAVDGSYQYHNKYYDWSITPSSDNERDLRRYDWFAGPLDGIGSFFYLLFFASVDVLIGVLFLLRSALRLGRRRF
ncbi:MAG: hypothetical protein HZA50_15105, partial [Planctomycetes bacterium]|nr:hypothetical protein [Planctomycetota bacterium]